MCLTGLVLRGAVVVLLVLLAASCCAKRRCSYREILGSYKEFILIELHSQNLTATVTTPKERDHCPSRKAHHVLRSIYGLTQQFQCQRGNSGHKDLAVPVESMQQLIMHDCSANLVSKASCPAKRRTQGRKRRRIKLIQLIRALIFCWQKLQSIYAETLH